MNKIKLLKGIRHLGCKDFDIKVDDYLFSFDMDSYSYDPSDSIIVEVNNKKWKQSCCLEINQFFNGCYLYDRMEYLPKFIFKKVQKAFNSKKVWNQIKQIYDKEIKDNFDIEE